MHFHCQDQELLGGVFFRFDQIFLSNLNLDELRLVQSRTSYKVFGRPNRAAQITIPFMGDCISRNNVRLNL